MLDVPPAHATYMAVSSWADPPPMMTAPVAQIVATAGRRARGPVAHLVRRVACGRESLIGDQVLVRKIILIGSRELTAPDPCRQPGTFLHDQCVGADVLGRR